jgi:hypothetical protein
MTISRPLAALIGVGVLGLAAIGVGAGASFTTDVQASQTITAGTLDVSVSAPGTDCPDATFHCHALTLDAVGPLGSTFETAPTKVTMTNTGNIPATFEAIQISETHGTADQSGNLRNQMNICIEGRDASNGTGPNWVEGNGPLTTAIALHTTVVENHVVLAPGQTATFWMSFYAGKNSSRCGTITSDGSVTTSNWVGYQGHGYLMPPSLTSAAMGGVVTPTLSYSFTG